MYHIKRGVKIISKKQINYFKGKYKFLSNFSNHGFKDHNNLYWKTNEHYYQAMKTNDLDEREKIRKISTPNGAKQGGKKVTLRNNWEHIKDIIMYRGLCMKFKQNPKIKNKLLQTKNALLIEGNAHGDVYWGKCNGIGKNKLGKLLMLLRQEFNTKLKYRGE
jgi:ribA/ribD-fused uncharacterized protein